MSIISKINDFRRIADEGYQAWKDGKELTWNPYNINTHNIQHQAWRSGWQHADYLANVSVIE